MGSQIIKVARDRDLYVEWSSIVEAPTFIGTRKKMIKELISDYAKGTDRRKDEKRYAKARLDRADEYGSSAYRPFGMYWGDDQHEIFEQRGLLYRRNLPAFIDIHMESVDEHDVFGYFTPEQWDALCDLLEPFEDEQQVRRER